MQSANHEAEAYARALQALAEAAEATPRFEQDIPAVSDLLLQNEEMRRFLADPAVQPAGKSFAVEQLLAGKAHPALVRFIQILQESGKMTLWKGVAGTFMNDAARSRQCVTGELMSPVSVSDVQLIQMEEEVSRILGKNVKLHLRIDETLLAGVIVRVGDFVLDGSLDSQINALHRGLVKSGDQ